MADDVTATELAATIQKVNVLPRHHAHALNSPAASIKYERCCTIRGKKLRFSVTPHPVFPDGCYHFSPSEEVHFQISGGATLVAVESGAPRDEDIVINEGQMFILPGRIPKRYKRSDFLSSAPSEGDGGAAATAITEDAPTAEAQVGSLGFVLDRVRPEHSDLLVRSDGSSDKWQVVHETSSSLASDALQAGGDPAAAVSIDVDTLLSKPFTVSDRVARLAQRDDAIRIYNGEFVIDLVGGNTRTPALPVETESWVWCVRGHVTINESLVLEEGECAIVPNRLENMSLSEDGAAFVAYPADTDV